MQVTQIDLIYGRDGEAWGVDSTSLVRATESGLQNTWTKEALRNRNYHCNLLQAELNNSITRPQGTCNIRVNAKVMSGQSNVSFPMP